MFSLSLRRRFSSFASNRVRDRNVFPSLEIGADRVVPHGPFAETQASFLSPHAETIRELDDALEKKKLGIVAHFYMDAELQGTLSALQWPHVKIADSLAMGDAAVDMARRGVTSIACLGVDFMSESVQANLAACGYDHVPVFRLSEREIGCSLASAAEKLAYEAWLQSAAKTRTSLHVVYINTSLITKAMSHSIVPTITCTSSNVIRTILQAFYQIPGVSLWYGPDTYMGSNLASMLEKISNMPNDKIREIHPGHSQDSIRDSIPRFHYFNQGNCIVHHMFSDSVTRSIRENYSNAFHTAHLEVPGEMFELALESAADDRGVVGSTSDILNFIKRKAHLVESGESIRVVLGTESGMITSIVRGVQEILRNRVPSDRSGGESSVEIIFPVASESFTVNDDATSMGDETNELSSLSIVPGVSGAEGCSSSGGCATCPYMKMNNLDSLMDLVSFIDGSNFKNVERFLPKKRQFVIDGEDRTSLGTKPILHMRHFMANQSLGDDLVDDVVSRNQ